MASKPDLKLVYCRQVKSKNHHTVSLWFTVINSDNHSNSDTPSWLTNNFSTPEKILIRILQVKEIIFAHNTNLGTILQRHYIYLAQTLCTRHNHAHVILIMLLLVDSQPGMQSSVEGENSETLYSETTAKETETELQAKAPRSSGTVRSHCKINTKRRELIILQFPLPLLPLL